MKELVRFERRWPDVAGTPVLAVLVDPDRVRAIWEDVDQDNGVYAVIVWADGPLGSLAVKGTAAEVLAALRAPGGAA